MSFLSPLFPQTVLRTSSPYNSDIRVIREWGGNKILVNGSRQSGPYIHSLWKRAFGAFKVDQLYGVTSILVLGIGGGTVIEILSSRYPDATITAVDIDPVMIDIANRYFHLNRIPHVHIVERDARVFVGASDCYDLIVIDLFIGSDIPNFVLHTVFYQKLKKFLLPKGTLIINYLQEHEYLEKSDALLVRLKRNFPVVHDYRIANNRFFLCRT